MAEVRTAQDEAVSELTAARVSLQDVLREFETRPNGHDGQSPHVRSLLDLIHAAPFDSRLSAKTLKAQCGASDHNVSSHFKFEIGESIMGYVTALRIEVAATCLRRTNSPVAEVALIVGFANLQRFYAAFKITYGTTPGAYARAHRTTAGDSR